MGSSHSIEAAYLGWRDDTGDVHQLRRYIDDRKDAINTKLLTTYSYSSREPCTALVKACKDGKAKIVDELIKAGADVKNEVA